MSRNRNRSIAISSDLRSEPVRHDKFNDKARLNQTEAHALALLLLAADEQGLGSQVTRLRERRFRLPDGQGNIATGDLVETSVEPEQRHLRCVFAMADNRALIYTLKLDQSELDFFQADPWRHSGARH